MCHFPNTDIAMTIKDGASNVILNEFPSFEMYFLFHSLYFAFAISYCKMWLGFRCLPQIPLKSIANGTEFFVVMDTFFIWFSLESIQ